MDNGVPRGAANQGEWQMPVWCRMFQQTLDGPTRGWFDRILKGCIDNWADLREKLTKRYALRRRCFKDPTKGHRAFPWGDRPPRSTYGGGSQRTDYGNDFNAHRDHYQLYVPPQANNQRYDNRRHDSNHLGLDALTKRPKEIIATKLQLQLLPCPPMRQLEIALESGKLSHLIKDVRQRGNAKGRQQGNNNEKGMLINMVMFKHCIDNLSPSMKARLTQNQTEFVGFSKEQLIPIGKVELEVSFGNKDMIGVPKRVIRHTLNVNMSIPLVAKKHRVLGTEKSQAVMKESGNLEAYVDDMVIKSKTDQEMIMDIAKTFDNLQRTNMKLNPKKCLFGMKEGKFFGYTITSEGIRANPKKTKAVADMQSPQTLKEMQSFSGKLAALN
uniref:Reverse transcriptase domain-containing protein n=1 Tax=Tanacetum cinerariifolium TaxID=118510 RepID=A0A6L2JYY0_TANCI|nr:reverse transcriptase domain-containing protein [Tanacetum cinerariifolium]